MVYLGAESGSDQVLEMIDKGVTNAQNIEAVQKIEESGIKSSVTFISGLGGREMWEEHGKIVEIAITNDAGSTHRAFLLAVMMGLDIQCSFGHSYDTWPKVLQMMAEGKISTKDLVSHKFVFEDINKAIELDDPAKLKILMHP
jgi:Fe-S oxidoreductase